MTAALFRPTMTVVYKQITRVWVATLALNVVRLFGQEAQPETHLFLVDVSESMWEKPPSEQRTELELRRDHLKTWLKSNETSRVTLMSFDTDVHSSLTCDLRDASDRQKADNWVNQVAIKRPRGTYLWSCVRKALKTASDLARQQRGQVVTLHVLTDRVDTERSSRREQVMREFPDAKWPADIAEGKGDFDVTVQIAASPTPSVSPRPSPTITASIPPTPRGSPSTTPTPTPPRPPDPGSPTPGSSQSPWPDPCTSPSPCSGNALFEAAQTHTVAHGQFVQFANKTEPRPTYHEWTIQRSGSPVLEYEKVAPRERSIETHWGYRFINRSNKAESYTVRLTAFYGKTKIEAAPLTIVVQPKPNVVLTFAPRLWHALEALGSYASQAVLFATAVLTLLKLWNGFNKARKRAQFWRTLFEDFRRWLEGLSWIHILICTVIAALCLYAFRGGAQPVGSSGGASTSSPATTAPGGIVILREGTNTSSFPGSALAALIGALITAAAFVAAGKGSGFKKVISWIPERTRSTIRTQLDELTEFSEAGTVQRQHARALRKELFGRWCERADLAKVEKEKPWVSDRLNELINRLVTATENKSQKWAKAATGRAGDSKPSENPRLVTLGPVEKKSVRSKSIAQVEISADGEGVTIAVFNGDRDVVVSIDEEDPGTPPETAAQLRKLYDLAKESAFGITKTLDAIIAELKTKPAANETGEA